MNLLLIKLREQSAPNMVKTYTPPIGLWSIREAAWRRGHKCTVVDMNIQEWVPIDEDFDVIGLSAQFSQQHDEYTGMVEWCRERWPDARVVSGGFHASAVDAPKGVDGVCHGAGEAYLFEDDPTPPYPTAEDMKPYWDLGRPHDLVSKTDRWMPIETSRGCNRACRFCGVGGFWGRWRSIPGISEYLMYLHTIGVEELFIEDDNLLRNGVPAGLDGFAWSTPNGVEIRKAIQHIDELGGCWRLSLPFETGSPHTASLMNLGRKWLVRSEARCVVSRLHDASIETCGFFIIGYPGETLEDIHTTLEYANSLPLDDRHIYIATPYPGTPLYEECKEKGYLRYDGPELYDKLQYTVGLIDTPEWSAEDIVQIRNADREAAIGKRTA